MNVAVDFTSTERTKPDVAVLMGGSSVESEISLLTGNGVMQALKSLGYPATRVDHGAGFVDELRRIRPVAVFNALHGGEGEDGTVQALLDWLGIPYQGTGVRASAVAMDKWLTKSLLLAEGLPAPRAIHMHADAARPFAVEKQFGLPCVVKPRAEGSAVGVSIVRTHAEWEEAVLDASVGNGEIIIEEYIEGREFTVAILDDRALPVVEIAPHDRFYSYKAKYTPGGSTHTVPAKIEPKTAEEMQRAALALHRALGCRDYSRVDIMLNGSGRMAILECNTLPGLTPLSLFPDAAKAAGISYEALVEHLLECALSRRGA
jgi:D-alanine-D-alanine ligase